MRVHRSGRAAVLAAGAALACVASSTVSSAQQEAAPSLAAKAAVVTPAAVAVPETTETYAGPNRALVGTGLVTFGLSYVPALIVASQSNQQADHHLYVPVVGPWLDLVNRPACGPESVACDTETTNKVLIGVDGVFQGIGALTLIAGFLSPEHESEVVTTGKPSIHLSPARMGAGGYGVTAFGDF